MNKIKIFLATTLVFFSISMSFANNSLYENVKNYCLETFAAISLTHKNLSSEDPNDPGLVYSTKAKEMIEKILFHITINKNLEDKNLKTLEGLIERVSMMSKFTAPFNFEQLNYYEETTLLLEQTIDDTTTPEKNSAYFEFSPNNEKIVP